MCYIVSSLPWECLAYVSLRHGTNMLIWQLEISLGTSVYLFSLPPILYYLPVCSVPLDYIITSKTLHHWKCSTSTRKQAGGVGGSSHTFILRLKMGILPILWKDVCTVRGRRVVCVIPCSWLGPKLPPIARKLWAPIGKEEEERALPNFGSAHLSPFLHFF